MIFPHISVKIFSGVGFIFGMLTELTKRTSHAIQVIHALPIRHG